MLLWFIPRPLLKLIGYVFGEKYFSSTDTSCSRCTAVFSVFLVPLAFAFGLIVLTLMIALMLIFLPVFLVFILPCAVVLQCRRIRKEKVIKIQEVNDESGSGVHQEELHPLKDTDEKTVTNAADLGREETKAVVNGGIILDQPRKIQTDVGDDVDVESGTVAAEV